LPYLPETHDDVTQQVSAPAVSDTVAPADVLARVKAEGLRRRSRRHRRNAALAMVAVVAVAVPLAALLPGDGGSQDLRVAASSPDAGSSTSSDDDSPRTTATTVEAPATTAVPVVDPSLPPASVPEGEPGVAPAPRPVPTTAAPAPSCRNSTDAACGEFRWDPAPAANQPMTVTITASNVNPAVGEEVVFTVTWSDPDAPQAEASFANGEDGVQLGTADTLCRGRYGAWEPPAASSGAGSFEFRHTYGAPGTYTATALVESVEPQAEGCDNWEAYASDATGAVTITVG